MSDWLSLQKSDLLWEIISEQESISEAVNFLGKIYNFKIHPYVLWVKQESVTKEQFIQSQIPLRFAIESFSQCLAGVLAHIPHIENRATLAYNIAKSHGDNQITKGHKYNFLSYLKYLGATPEELFTSCPINLRAFTQSIQNFCLANPFYSGASLLGTLEFFFATVNSAIRNILKEKNWIEDGDSSNSQLFIMGQDHALELFEIARPGWDYDFTRIDTSSALILGAHYLWDLFEQQSKVIV